ncbi:menaquinone biosynthesis protein [bacterium]|nr:menaquinone biosynthesis protein [bacterium]
MPYRIAAVSFLNTVPLIEGLVAAPHPDVILTVDLPSRLAAQLSGCTVDAALVPAVEILRGRTGGILSPTGIACDGPVDSVALFAAGPLDGIRTVWADRGSRSSVALLQVLLAEFHGVRPEFRETEPVPGRRLPAGEGMLVIGDRCFAQAGAVARDNPDDLRMYDLGSLWKDLTGLPFVFAAWAAAPDLTARLPRDRIGSLGALLTASRDFGLQRLDELAVREAAAGKLGRGGEAGPGALAYYFGTSLRFVLGEGEWAGMRRFQELCIAHGLAPDLPFPELLFPRS